MRLALALHLTANTITVFGFVIVVAAAVLVGTGNLLVGAVMLTAGSLLDAVDGALARATGGSTPFGSFLDSTLDRAAEAVLYGGIAAYFLLSSSRARRSRCCWRWSPWRARSWSATRGRARRASASPPRSASRRAWSGWC